MLSLFSRKKGIKLSRLAVSLCLLSSCSFENPSYRKEFSKRLSKKKLQLKIVGIEYIEDVPKRVVLRSKTRKPRDNKSLEDLLTTCEKIHERCMRKVFGRNLPLKELAIHNVDKKLRRPSPGTIAKISLSNGIRKRFERDCYSQFLRPYSPLPPNPLSAD